MLNHWNHHNFLPTASSPGLSLSSSHINPLNLAIDFDNGILFDFHSVEPPAPWFIYSFMGVGVLVCCITLLGCIAAESFSGCCLCFYAVLKTMLILVEVALVAFIAVDHHWEKDIPFDPTGELDSFRSFVEDNIDICKWVGITVVVIQALSLPLALILRASVSTRSPDVEGDEDGYDVRRRTWEPLINPQVAQPSGAHSDIWSSRMREKYGLNSGDKYAYLPNQNHQQV